LCRHTIERIAEHDLLDTVIAGGGAVECGIPASLRFFERDVDEKRSVAEAMFAHETITRTVATRREAASIERHDDGAPSDYKRAGLAGCKPITGFRPAKATRVVPGLIAMPWTKDTGPADCGSRRSSSRSRGRICVRFPGRHHGIRRSAYKA
jgi:hypothetical protein